MMRNMGFMAALVLATLAVASPASARRLSVEIRTDKGHEAVYEPNDELRIKTKASTDAYLLIYEIDAEGFVHVLFPERPTQDGWIEGGKTVRLPDRSADYALVVQEPVGQAFIVAIAARDPFDALPWYLRGRNAQAEEIGYHGLPGDEGDEEEEGITEDGRIVGDPFVAMERIRRQVVGHDDDIDAFATAYTSYYVHEEVSYPRYMCYDCHRPRHWNWWAGFDPYYSRCSTMDVRVNWSWSWGPSYWFGYTPYFVYVYRPDCPPHYRYGYDRGDWYSSWNGYGRWRDLWGGSLIRYKSKPPRGYIGPGKGKRASRDKPPGYMGGGKGNGRIKPAGEPRPGRGTLAGNRRKPGAGRAIEPRVTARDRKATVGRKGKTLKRDRNTRLGTGKSRTSDDRRKLRIDKPRTGKVRDVRKTPRGRSKSAVGKQAPKVRKQKVQRSKAKSPPKRIRATDPKVGGRSKSTVKAKPATPKRGTKTETKAKSKRSTGRSKG